MPRMPRNKSCTGVYHCMIRGINKQDIFLDEQDKRKFMKELKRTKEQYKYELYSYCLMPNHVHLEIKENDEKIDIIMKSIQISYSKYFNLKYERVGHLFQNRYLSKNIETDESLLGVLKYIHQNPEKAGIAKTEKYKWSSYHEYIVDEGLTNRIKILQFFNEDNLKAIEEYKKMHIINRKQPLQHWKEKIEYGWDNKIDDEKLVEIIQQIVNDKNIYKVLTYNKKQKKEMLNKIKEETKVSNKQIARIFGISVKTLQRIK